MIHLDNAKKDKLFYVVANVVVFRESDKKCLILKRHERETAHPNKYAVPGGKLEWAQLNLENPTRRNGDILDFEDELENLLRRETFEEAGISIKGPFVYLNNVVFVRPDGIPVCLLKFAARYEAGDVMLEEGSFTDYAWVDANEVKSYDCILGIIEEVQKTIELFSVR